MAATWTRGERDTRGVANFSVWIIATSLFHLLLAITMIYLQETWAENDDQRYFVHYILTFVLLYAYARMVMQAATLRLLSRSSPVFSSLPGPYQAENAYLLMEGVTGFLWYPIIIYGAIIVFLVGDTRRFFMIYGPVAKTSLGMYHVDRVMQLLVRFNMEKFVHHFVTCVWMLLVIEWLPLRLTDPVILVVGALMEAQGKIMYPLIALLRIARHYGRTCQEDPNLSLECLQGLDCVLVGSSPQVMAQRAIGGFRAYFVLEEAVPVSLMVAYFCLFHKQVSVYWIVASAIIVAFFLVLDQSIPKFYWPKCRVSFWREAFSLPEPEKKARRKGDHLATSFATAELSSAVFMSSTFMDEKDADEGVKDGDDIEIASCSPNPEDTDPAFE